MRILILITALFFAAGFVSAQTEAESSPPSSPVNPNAYTLTEISTEDNVTGYVWTAPGKDQPDSASGESAGYRISVNVVRLDAADNWSYTAFDKNDPDTKWELSAEVKEDGQSVPNPYLLSSNDVYDFIEEPVKDENGNDVLDEDGNVRTERKQGDLALRVYSFSLPVETGKSKAPVIAVRNNTANVSSDSNVATENGELFYKMSETSLAFGVAPNPENGEEAKPDVIITIGQPLPSSVITLLIGLGFCAALVLYRKYRQEARIK
jgi:hypothetical protein